jgi:hypothetical protein
VISTWHNTATTFCCVALIARQRRGDVLRVVNGAASRTAALGYLLVYGTPCSRGAILLPKLTPPPVPSRQLPPASPSVDGIERRSAQSSCPVRRSLATSTTDERSKMLARIGCLSVAIQISSSRPFRRTGRHRSRAVVPPRHRRRVCRRVPFSERLNTSPPPTTSVKTTFRRLVLTTAGAVSLGYGFASGAGLSGHRPAAFIFTAVAGGLSPSPVIGELHCRSRVSSDRTDPAANLHHIKQ